MIQHLERMQLLNQLNTLQEFRAAMKERMKNLSDTDKKYAAEERRINDLLTISNEKA